MIDAFFNRFVKNAQKNYFFASSFELDQLIAQF
jgi:hypothetical protein